jgi:hypothetical protein
MPLSFVTILAACSPSSLVDVQSPSTVVDPSLIDNATAAAQLRTGAIVRMMGAFGRLQTSSVVVMSGTLTDELSESYYYSGLTGNDRNVLNTAVGKNTGGFGYDVIQLARIKAQQAQQALQLYASNSSTVPRAWQGEMYALEGYTVIWLAELYCSGIPLTSAPLVGTAVPTRGLTTTELFNSAIALFDSAVVAGADSAQYVDLARVGKARALLDLGQFEAADSAVQDVPTSFVYVVPSASSTTDSYGFFTFPTQGTGGYYRVEDHEGGNGLVWSTDPRTGVTTVDSLTGTMLWAGKYNVSAGVVKPTVSNPGASLRLADGLEARLIQAEAALARGDASWLTILNTLRATCYGTAPCAPISTLTATSLPPLSDPGTPDARLDTVMQERAMWLYLSGHREGDLRRMAHVYNRDPSTLWPTGIISIPAYPPMFTQPGSENGTPYGADVVYGPDVNEQLRNPLYGGCYDTHP